MSASLKDEFGVNKVYATNMPASRGGTKKGRSKKKYKIQWKCLRVVSLTPNQTHIQKVSYGDLPHLMVKSPHGGEPPCIIIYILLFFKDI